MERANKRLEGKAPERAMEALVYLSLLVPFAVSLLYVRSFGVNVFFADEWDFVVPLREATRGTLGVADLFAHHNEHVYFFPWTLMLLVGKATAYDTVPFMYLVQVCLFVTVLAVLYAYVRSVGRTPPLYLLFLPLPFLLFSLRQHENMLWGNQVSFAFAQTFSVLALCLLFAASGERPGKLPFPTALLSATVASYSAVAGLLVWPAGLLQLLLAPVGKGRTGRLAAGVWTLAGACVWAGYLAGYEKPKSTPPLSFVLGHPADGLGYLFTLVGSSLFWRGGAAFVAGLVLVCLAAVGVALAYGRGKVRENSVWISLLAFSLLALALVTVGRSGFEEEQAFAQALASRFTAFSIPLVVALYALFVNLARERSRAATACLVVLLAAVLFSVPRSYALGVEAGAATEASREQAVRVLAEYESRPDAVLAAYFGRNPRAMRRYILFLDKHDYGVFARLPSSGEPGEPGRGGT